METEWYVIDTRSNEIVNCITVMGGGPPRERTLAMFEDAEHMRLDRNPPMEMLRRYRYWNERP